MKPAYPFSGILGQPKLQCALLLLAIDPRIGGLLIEGPRGTAKSTSARALAELLPGGAFVTLPLGATEEMLIGSLNIDAALQDGVVQFSPGLLAKAHEGVLYVDEVNLLPDVLVDQLLDVAASGVNVIERDGISHQHAARFALIGTMNPEEGELRPQLLDRFGLAVALENCGDAALRREIVKARLNFDAQPAAFRERFADAQAEVKARITQARAALARVSIEDAAYDRIGALCVAAQVDGLRADLVMARAAKAFAALERSDCVTPEHVDAVAELALHHRRQHAEPQLPDTTSSRLAAAPSDLPASQAEAGTQAWGELPPSPVVALPARRVSVPAQKKRP